MRPRLAAEVGEELASLIHEAMLLDTIDCWDRVTVLAPGGRRVLVYAPDDAGPWFDTRVPAGYALQPQVEGCPGRRMRAFFEGEFEDGAGRVVLIGSDAPTLDPTIVISAFLCLEGRDVVLGPAYGGGYYLVGARRSVPPIFEGIDWGSPEVLIQAVGKLEGTGLSLSVLPPWYDVDSLDGWRTLSGHIRALHRAGIDPGLPRLLELVEQLS